MKMNETTIDKIFNFKQLNSGWCYGEGISISDEIIEKAARLEARGRLVGFRETDAFPGLNGEVSVALYFQKHYFEFTFETDNRVLFVHEKNEKTIVYNHNLTFELALKKVESLREFLWPSLEYFTNDFMTKDVSATKVTPLKKQEMGEFLLSKKTVLSSIVETSVYTSENIIPEYMDTPLLIGSLTETYSQKIVV